MVWTSIGTTDCPGTTTARRQRPSTRSANGQRPGSNQTPASPRCAARDRTRAGRKHQAIAWRVMLSTTPSRLTRKATPAIRPTRHLSIICPRDVGLRMPPAGRKEQSRLLSRRRLRIYCPRTESPAEGSSAISIVIEASSVTMRAGRGASSSSARCAFSLRASPGGGIEPEC